MRSRGEGPRSLLRWLQRRRIVPTRLGLSLTDDGVALALAERNGAGDLALQWSELLAGDSRSVPETASTVNAERDRRSVDRRTADRRQSDRRQGDRRQGDRRDAGSAPASAAVQLLPRYGALLSALRRVVRERDLRRIPCTALLSPGDYSLVLVDSPDVPADEVRAAMRWQVRDLIDFHVDDAVIDVFDLPERSGHSTRRMYAVAARRERVTQLIDLLREAEIDLVAIDIPEMSLRNLAARLREDDDGVALVAFDSQQGLMTITRERALFFSRRIDCSSARLVAAASAGGFTPELETLLDGLAVEIQRSLDFYESHFNQPSVAAVYLVPVPGMGGEAPAHLQSRLGIPTRWMDVASACGAPSEMSPLFAGSPVLGAALREELAPL